MREAAHTPSRWSRRSTTRPRATRATRQTRSSVTGRSSSNRRSSPTTPLSVTVEPPSKQQLSAAERAIALSAADALQDFELARGAAGHDVVRVCRLGDPQRIRPLLRRLPGEAERRHRRQLHRSERLPLAGDKSLDQDLLAGVLGRDTPLDDYGLAQVK